MKKYKVFTGSASQVEDQLNTYEEGSLTILSICSSEQALIIVAQVLLHSVPLRDTNTYIEYGEKVAPKFPDNTTTNSLYGKRK